MLPDLLLVIADRDDALSSKKNDKWRKKKKAGIIRPRKRKEVRKLKNDMRKTRKQFVRMEKKRE